MSIKIEDMDILKDKTYLPTSNEKYVVSEDYEMIFNDPELKVLGFIKDRMYIYTDNYVSKYTVDGKFISRLYLEVDHGTFNDNVPFMYLFKDNILYKVTSNLEISWSVVLDDYIRSITIDSVGSVYILFMNSRNIYKYNQDGKMILYLHYDDDVSKVCRLYRCYVTPGRSFVYIVGTLFYERMCDCFVAKYDTRKGKIVDKNILCTVDNVLTDSEDYEFDDIYVDGDYVYLKGHNFIQKVNVKMQMKWKHFFGYNEISNRYNQLSAMEYDNSSYQKYIYFCEDLYDTNGYSYGKISTDGNLIWKMTTPSNDKDIHFNIAVKDEYIYAYNRESLQALIPSILSVNNNSLLFETREGKLIRLVEYNNELYNSSNFSGKNLYADEIKKEYPQYIYAPLLYHIDKDHMGPVVNEEDKILIFGDKYKPNAVDENYIYRRLIADTVDNANYVKSRIKTKSGLFLNTKNGNRIRTRNPYKIELSYDVLRTKSGEVIRTSQGEELLRKAGKPYIYYGLLSDYFKFYTALITKRKHNILVTKNKQDYLCRKTNEVYKYYLRKLKDINLLVEYIIQNDVLETMYPNYVEKLKHHTFHMLDDVQKASCPSYYDLKATKVNKYTYDSNTFYIEENYVSVFLCKNIPFIKKKDYQPIDIRSMAEMVIDETVTPFIMFVNGRAIKWSNMTIVRDWHESYIIIENMNDYNVFSDKVDCIVYPCTVHYGEDPIIDETNDTGLYFSEDGLFTTNIEKIAMRIEVLDKDVISTTQRIDENKDYIEMDLDKRKLATEYNIFVFDNGLFDSDNRYYLNNTGYNIFGYNKETENAVFRTFFYIRGLESKNMIFKIPNTEQVKEDVINSITGKGSKPYLTNLNHNFDFHFSRNKSYDRNIAEAMDYISSYDISLLMDYYKKQSNIKTITMTGKEVNSKVSDGVFTIPRHGRSHLQDFIIVYKNGLLYEDYHNIEYSIRSISIPISGLLDEDTFEIVHFMNVCNDSYGIKIVDKNTPVIIPQHLRHDNFLLYANAINGEYPSSSDNVYDVGFSYINHFNMNSYKNTNIELNNIYFYDKLLNIVSKRQFHHQRITTIADNGVYVLNEEFKFAQNIDQYIVMVNGKRINISQWNLLISPELQIQINVNETITQIDVFYVPDVCEEIYIEQYKTSLGFGDVDIPSSEEFDLPFDKDVFFVYVDGKKVPISDIENVDKNSFRLINESDIINNLCICKYMQSDVIMKELFSYEELWSNGTQTLNKEVYQRLFTKL